MTGSCKFCDLYKQLKTLNRENEKEFNARPGRSFKIKSVLKASIVDITYRYYEGEKREEGGRITHRSRPLKYCPECGKKLTRERRQNEHQL